MSVDIDWLALTGGTDGAGLAETIRLFVHDKFQQVPLPRFVRLVQVHGFEFGDVAPELEIKDICDPLPDFYEEDSADDGEDDVSTHESARAQVAPSAKSTLNTTSSSFAMDPYARQPLGFKYDRVSGQQADSGSSTRPMAPRNDSIASQQLLSPSLLDPSTHSWYPWRYLEPQLFSHAIQSCFIWLGTPLAAVAGAQFGGAWHEPREKGNTGDVNTPRTRPHAASISSITPPSTADPSSRPSSQHTSNFDLSDSQATLQETGFGVEGEDDQVEHDQPYEPDAKDIQVIAHVKYDGDVKLVMTASILLDYPMPSFVEIPVKLTITGLRFDGVAITAYIRRKAHFCFLAPEDAQSLLEGEDISGDINPDGTTKVRSTGGLLEQIRVESEIGHKEAGKQILKNVGKVEKFILEQVRRIFEDEFVYPNFWTFLV